MGWLAASSPKGGGAEGGCCITPLYSSSLARRLSLLTLHFFLSMTSFPCRGRLPVSSRGKGAGAAFAFAELKSTAGRLQANAISNREDGEAATSAR